MTTLPATWRLTDGRFATALDVRRIAKSVPSFRSAVDSGVDADDLLQEVWSTLLKRQHSSPYDPRRGSFSKYVYLVTRTTISHVMERRANLAKHEQVSLRDQDGESVDASVWAENHAAELDNDEKATLVEALGADRHSEIARFLVTGRSIKEAKRVFGPRWHSEIDRLAGRVHRRLSESVRLQRLDNDKQ